MKSAYRLRLEKVYLCTGRDAYIPYFDPTGNVYGEGPSYGCIQPGNNLQHRFLLLDRENPDSQDLYFHDVPFKAYFASDHPDFTALSEMSGVDGFLLSVDALYTVKTGQQWFLQVLYEIGTDELLRNGRAKRAASMIAIANKRRHRRSANDAFVSSSHTNGTNMQQLILVETPSQLPVILLIVGLSLIAVLIILLCCCCCILKRRRKKKEKQPAKVVEEEEMEELYKPVNSSVNVKVVSLTKNNKADNKLEKNCVRSRQKRDVNIAVQPINDGRQNNDNSSLPLLHSKRKNIPIVNNLKNNRDDHAHDDDGTEV